MQFTLPKIFSSTTLSTDCLRQEQQKMSRTSSLPSLSDTKSPFNTSISSPLSADEFLESLGQAQGLASIEGLAQNSDQKQHTHENFSLTIQNFIDYAESRPSQSYSITSICDQFKFQRRRFYDVINVLEITGCCKRINVDTITWFGRQNVRSTLKELVRISQIHSKSTIASILPKEKIITIAHLTKVYLLIFSFLNQNQLDIRATAQVIAKENGRFKTTLCKLYQITHILCAAKILVKSDVPSIVSMKPEYFVPSSQPLTLPILGNIQKPTVVPDTLKIENLLSSENQNQYTLSIPFSNQRANAMPFCLPSYGGSYLPIPLVSALKC